VSLAVLGRRTGNQFTIRKNLNKVLNRLPEIRDLIVYTRREVSSDLHPFKTFYYNPTVFVPQPQL